MRDQTISPYLAIAFGCVLLSATGCTTTPRPGAQVPRTGDEIMVAGQLFHTGTRVVLWTDPGGYDAYRVERRFAPFEQSDWDRSHTDVRELRTPNRYGLRMPTITKADGERQNVLTPEQIEQVRGGGWDLPLLQSVVDQFVLHFDVAGVSRQCFNTLQDHRDLSVHFMCDLDGTIYQTLDLKERAWHATIANTRSVGIEIANMGGYGDVENSPLTKWYRHDSNGQTTITIPANLGDGGIRTRGFVGHPARPDLVRGNIQGEDLAQYDFTPQQYAALIRLTATLCTIFPKIKCDFPHDENGKVIPKKLSNDELKTYQGVLGHYHIQTDKTDPGPAFQWDYLIDNARRVMNGGFSPAANETSAGQMRSRM